MSSCRYTAACRLLSWLKTPGTTCQWRLGFLNVSVKLVLYVRFLALLTETIRSLGPSCWMPSWRQSTVAKVGIRWSRMKLSERTMSKGRRAGCLHLRRQSEAGLTMMTTTRTRLVGDPSACSLSTSSQIAYLMPGRRTGCLSCPREVAPDRNWTGTSWTSLRDGGRSGPSSSGTCEKRTASQAVAGSRCRTREDQHRDPNSGTSLMPLSENAGLQGA
mmetsp:Transcript_64940/g.141551  ORF Transcript_64940/g.141551 Transcript_64940/m.141551 type:complete len:217 (-) Transcript_64940:97-747(-)